jgi:hypothetical protein
MREQERCPSGGRAGCRAAALAIAVFGLAPQPATAGVAIPSVEMPSFLAAGPAAPYELSPPSRPPVLRLVLFDVHALLGPFSRVMTDEIARMLDDAGIATAWTEGGLGATFGTSVDREIPVIALHRPSRHDRAAAVMGAVHRQATRPAVWIFLDNIRLGLRQDPDKRPCHIAAREVAIAAARVVVHELVHALAPEKPHAAFGLMKGTLDRADLLAPRLLIMPDAALAMQAALGGAPRGVPASSGALKAAARRPRAVR